MDGEETLLLLERETVQIELALIGFMFYHKKGDIMHPSPFSGLLLKVSMAAVIRASDIIFIWSLRPWMEIWKRCLEVSPSFSTPTYAPRNPSPYTRGTPTGKPHVLLRARGQADNENAQR